MRLVSYEALGCIGVGVAVDAGVAPVSGYCSLLELLRDGEAGLARAHHAVADAEAVVPDRILAPLRPPKLLGGGVNYAGHEAVDANARVPDEPFFFVKLSTAVVGPGDEIVVPYAGMTVDCGVELCVVVGSTIRNAPTRHGLDFVVGYTLLNDVSARAIGSEHAHLTLNKGMDTFAPIGPAILTVDEVADLADLTLSTSVNGELRQEVVAKSMHWQPGEWVEWISSFITLEPGDVISTGTPPGFGNFHAHPIALEPGDTVTVAAPGIGELTNHVVGPSSSADPWGVIRAR